MKTKFLHLIALLFTIGSFAQTLGDTFQVDGLDYEVTATDPNEVEITGGENIPEDLVIPATVENDEGDSFDVTSIGAKAFEGAGLTSVSIPSGIRLIGQEAFRSNSLTSVAVPGSVVTIGIRAFNTNQISNLNLGNGVEIIAASAFGRNSLATISLPASVTAIGTFAFFNNSITNIESLGNAPASIQENSFGDRSNISLTVPEGMEAAYENGGWIGFQTINDAPFIGLTFIIDELQYTVDQLEPNTATLSNGIDATGNIQIPTSVSFNGVTYSVTTIASDAFLNGSLTGVIIPNSIVTIQNNAFRNNQLTTVEIPESVINIGANAFSDNSIDSLIFNEGLQTIRTSAFQGNNLTTITIPNGVVAIGEDAFNDNPLTTIVSESLSAPSLDSGAFGSGTKKLTVPVGTETAYAEADWTDFLVVNDTFVIGENFNVDGLNYEVSSTDPTANLTSASGQDIVVPDAVFILDLEIIITGIGNEIFRNSTRNTVVLGENIERLGDGAFRRSTINQITSKNTTPPVLGNLAFADRSRGNIGSIVVPVGTIDAYAAAGWPADILVEESNSITLNLKVFLQGAYINPNTAEEDLRNDLQEASLIPLTSTYADERSAARFFDTTQFFLPFELKIADWVFVEIRDANEPSSVLDSRSLLLQTNGDIVDFTFDSEFTNPTFDRPFVDEYLVVIKHRNHISIQTANAISSQLQNVTLDFTSDPTLVEGVENALVEVSDGIFAMISGDFNENGQVQPSDVNETTAAIGTSSYSNADMDMNGQIQPADVNNLVNPNVGRGVQF